MIRVIRTSAQVLLELTADMLPIRSIEREILNSALLYLRGNLSNGATVECWWKLQDQQEAHA